MFTKFKELRNVARSKKTINDLTLWKSFGACMMAALMDVREAPDIALLFIPCNLLKLKALIHVERGKRKGRNLFTLGIEYQMRQAEQPITSFGMGALIKNLSLKTQPDMTF